jgi:hypothetical protein
MVSQSLFAQSATPVAIKPLPVRETIADAEAEGATFPHGPPREHTSTIFARQSPGTVERKCVNGASTDMPWQPMQIRSGDFVIGGQVGAGVPLNVGRQSKVWWVPYHDPFEFPSKLLVRGARLGAPGDTIRYEQPDYAWPSPGVKTDSFFPSGITIPRAGRWLLIATAGDDWGCFILSTGA